MASLQLSPLPRRSLSPLLLQRFIPCCGRGISFIVRAEQSLDASTSDSQDKRGRREIISFGIVAPWIPRLSQAPPSFAAETKKGFIAVTDKKDGYSFLYPFGWQEVVIEGQDKVFKDVIEPLESVNRLLKHYKVLAPPTQKATLIKASGHDVDGKAYYMFDFTAQAKNYTRHALSTITVTNGKFYTLTTRANQRRDGAR